MLVIYTGDGKGKTSACVGQALRALGQDLDVAFAQFMKRDVQAGEQRLLGQLLGPRFHSGGSGFFRHEAERPRHREAALRTLAWARDRLAEVDMLILDETLYALGAGLLSRDEVEELLALAAQHQTHLVLSGRGLPDWLCAAADLVTEMCERKHPWQAGIPACKGIEY